MKIVKYIIHIYAILVLTSVVMAAGVYQFPMSDPCTYTMLKVESSELQDLHDQLSMDAAVVPWQNANSCDIMMSAPNKSFGHRIAVFYALPPDKRQSADMKNMPVYDTGRTITELTGFAFQCLPQKNGLFDLVANGIKPAFRHSELIYYKNTGKPGSPHFEKARPLQLDGKPFNEVFNQSISGWYIDDFTGDGIPDMVMAAHSKSDPNKYWPDGMSMWSGIPTPNSGPGCGYDIEGNWLGLETTNTLYWAKGFYTKSGNLQFRNIKKVFYRLQGFAVQWKSYFHWGALGAIDLNNKKYLLCTGNIDKLLSMQIILKDGDLYCSQAVNFLKDKKLLYANFYPSKLITIDIDKDGDNEVLFDGNVGKVVVLKGKQAGQFVEVGPLQMLGGDLCVNALATPTRIDWNNDGFDDLIVGDSGGWLTFWPGTKDPLVYKSPTYMKAGGKIIFQQAGLTGSIQGPSEKRWGYIYPTAGDWDEDGQDEVITNNINSEVFLFEREDKNSIDFALPKQFTLDGEPLPAAWRVKVDIVPSSAKVLDTNVPCLLYLDWDGDLVLGVPKTKGSTEIARVEKLKYDTGKNIPLCGPEGHWGRTKLAVADWDNDGDWDVIFGDNGKPIQYFLNIKTRSTVFFMENCGTSSRPVFKKPVLITVSNGQVIDCGGHNASVCPTDLDNDGKLDLLIGVENGKIIVFNRKNLSTKAF